MAVLEPMIFVRDDPGQYPRWPTGHVGWTFSGRPEFEGRATMFLAEGATRHERLMFVADDPDLRQWPKTLLDQGTLVVASTREVYGDDGVLDSTAQRATFESFLDQSLDRGYAGIRVAADNTAQISGISGISGSERLAAWLAWEEEVDRLSADRPVTGLCGFDRTRATPEPLRRVMAAHRVTPASEAQRGPGAPGGGGES